ncbi:MAG: hypothetical protein ACOX68_01950 [Candidatus Limivicinus sp.]|jgi:sporulation integral membrane protein YlbJ
MKSKIAVISSLCALAALIFSSDAVISSCRYALELCCEMIVPTLFPFFVISILLNRLGLPAALGKLLQPLAIKLFNVSGTAASALVIGLSGGYPLGAAYIADMHASEVISTEEAERLLGFCNNSGPAFLIGAIGTGVFHSPKIGLMLYLVHISAAVICGIIMRDRSSMPVPVPMEIHYSGFSTAFPGAVKQAVISILNVCGFVVCFSVLVGILDAGGFLSLLIGLISEATGWQLQWIRALLTGLLELGSGIGAMRGLECSPINIALAAFLAGWGGLSVHFQTRALIAGTKIKGALHFAGRLMSASISAVLAYCSALFFI